MAYFAQPPPPSIPLGLSLVLFAIVLFHFHCVFIIFTFNLKSLHCSLNIVLILDGSSDHDAHIWSKSRI